MGCTSRTAAEPMLTVPFLVLNNSDHPLCGPLIVVKSLLRAGALPRFQSMWGKALGGDCHRIAGVWMEQPCPLSGKADTGADIAE
jgi:hypothetical protein